MRPALATVLTGSRRPLCAVCAQAALGTGAMRTRRQAFSAAAAATTAMTTNTTTTATTMRVRSGCTAPKQLWRRLLSQTIRASSSSSSSSSSASQRCDSDSAKPSDSTAEEQTKQTRQQTQSQKPALPFYALFPESLPQGPPPEGPFAVDVRALRREFLRLQAAAHPDFHHSVGGGSSEERDSSSRHSAGHSAGHSVARARAEAASARINEAFATLASPLLRAQYLLRERFGMDLAGDESTAAGGVEDADKTRNMDLFMAVLEAREDIEAATCEADLTPLRTANDGRMRASEAALAEAFAADDGEAARHEAVRLRYWTSIEETLREWEPGRAVVMQH